jgi:cell division protein ZapA (FtsZ GTPase activity inhibitor)
MAQSINVNIAERTFSLKVNSPEHEELIRKAADEINRKVKFYLDRFPGKSLHEVITLVALNTGIAYAGLQKQMEIVLGAEESLAKELDGYLENIDKNSR